MKKKKILFWMTIFIANSIFAQEGCRKQGLYFVPQINCANFEHGDWILVFEDDFEGNTLNKDVWFTCEDGWNRVHGDELQYYMDDNISVQNGILHLTARNEPGRYEYWDFDNDGSPTLASDFFLFTSGWIQTKKSFLYGLFEVRCKVPWGNGLWPAFWLFGNGYELDIFEFKGQDPFTCHFNVHNWKNDNHFSCGNSYTDEHYAFSNEYHTYSIEWDEFYLIYRIDGEEKRRVSRYSDEWGRTIDNCNTMGNFHHLFDRLVFPRAPMSIILNLAISSGNYGNPPNANTIFPSLLDIDYIRVYKRTNPHRYLTIDETYDNSLLCYTGGDIRIQGTGPSFVFDSNENLSFYATNEIELGTETDILHGSNVEFSIVSTHSYPESYDMIVLEKETSAPNKPQDIDNQPESIIIISPNPTSGFFFDRNK